MAPEIAFPKMLGDFNGRVGQGARGLAGIGGSSAPSWHATRILRGHPYRHDNRPNFLRRRLDGGLVLVPGKNAANA